MTQDRDKPETKIRKIFKSAAFNVGLSIFFLAVGLDNAMIHAVRLRPDTFFLPELLLDFGYFLLSALCMGYAVHRFAKACMLLAGLKGSAERG
jgi:hypothetical protein